MVNDGIPGDITGRLELEAFGVPADWDFHSRPLQPCQLTWAVGSPKGHSKYVFAFLRKTQPTADRQISVIQN